MRSHIFMCALIVTLTVSIAALAQQSTPRTQAETLFVEAQKALSHGDATGAESILKDALSIDPAFTSAIWQLAQIYESQGKLDYARELLIRGLGQEPDASWARERLAKLEGAIARTLLVEARTALNSGDYDGAIPKLSTYLGLKPNDPVALVSMAKCQVAKGKHRAAREYLAKARAIDPDNAEIASIAAELNKGDRDERLKKLLSEAQIALIDTSSAGPDRARAALAAVLAEDPANAWAKEMLADLNRPAPVKPASAERHENAIPTAVAVQGRKALDESKGAISTAGRFVITHVLLFILAAVLTVLVIDIRRRMMRRSHPLEGTISLIPILDIVSLVNANLRTGRLLVVNPDAKGEIYFEKGEIIHARCGALTGKIAFHKLMDLRSGRFFFHNHLPNVRRSITEPLSLLLLSMKPAEEMSADTERDATREKVLSTHR
jgi:Tfp pilus assembly protein PilF